MSKTDSANFSKIYRFYDYINSLLTLGFDKSWREKASDELINISVLDLGSGTGATKKQLSKKIVGSAETLPFNNETFDNVYCAFVWRNVSDVNKAFEEIRRVLKEGGKFILLDMTRPVNKVGRRLHMLGTFVILHLVGVLTFNFKEYRFLYTSLDKLPPPEVFLKESGFKINKVQRMGLFGFVYLAVLEKN